MQHWQKPVHNTYLWVWETCYNTYSIYYFNIIAALENTTRHLRNSCLSTRSIDEALLIQSIWGSDEVLLQSSAQVYTYSKIYIHIIWFSDVLPYPPWGCCCRTGGVLIADVGPWHPVTSILHIIYSKFTLRHIVGVRVVEWNTSTGSTPMVHQVRHQRSDSVSRYRATRVLHKGTDVVICACDLFSVGVLPIAIDVSVDAVSQSYHCIALTGAQGTASAVDA